ncbi:hypothetical protein UB31_29780 [Bradyrhizobium sp. LTSP849]|nr:hypothetical protein UP06_37000 [Bradyrhizobium sp. LTSP857]KJC39612.1 hypothetical protein UB31_29780 [Bradyrhizobium sp. LTSP849]
MRTKWVFVLIGSAIGTMAISAVAADPRDSVDRGQRLDTDALRDDVGTNRLRAPSHPLVIAPVPQPIPTAKGKKRTKSSDSNR